jgi:ATP-dependent DNA helicase RecQ
MTANTDVPANTNASAVFERLASVLRKYWGYDSFRPLQAEAMQAVLDGRDSVVVMPTGGGKSLCFQAPAVTLPGMAIVVSPLISLMKDQVDALQGCGVPAACINSTHSYDERRDVAEEIRAGRLKLLYVAPERLVMERTLEFLSQANVSLVAIDEAHCISEWGHDFRPEYRGLRLLKDRFAGAAVHAYTATATPRVRGDIADQLGLENPEVFVGSCDRPNLIYKVDQSRQRLTQVADVVGRHSGESGIVYCISRRNVEKTCQHLNALGHRALTYHAGMEDELRKRNQEAFIQEEVDTIVATVAFGMGIDKSNVRYVVHAGMPKSLENYQQESGRAGRDGLEAECCLFYSGSDYNQWKTMLADLEGPAYDAAIKSLGAMYDYATGVVCRHRTLVSYFGQELQADGCNACDVCLGDLDLVGDAITVAQKILSCVVRLEQRFGGEYTSLVLTGSNDQRILHQEHDQLSTYGLLSGETKQNVRGWIEQLLGQGYLAKNGEYNVLCVTPSGREVLRGDATPKLLKPKKRAGKKRREKARSGVAADSWEGVDDDLFEVLRGLRRELADDRGIPPYLVFSDATLREMARDKPTDLDRFLDVKGVGEKKRSDYGEVFVTCIVEHAAKKSE